MPQDQYLRQNVVAQGNLNVDDNVDLGNSTADVVTINGELQIDSTVTAGGTTGAQTINKVAGSVNFAAAATSLVVTNSLVTADSLVLATVATNDTTMTSVQAVAAAGSFTLHANAAATAETRVVFLVVEPTGA